MSKSNHRVVGVIGPLLFAVLFGSAGLPANADSAACGSLPPGATTWTAAASPVEICAGGLTVPGGSALVIDASSGPVEIHGARCPVGLRQSCHDQHDGHSGRLLLRRSDQPHRVAGNPIRLRVPEVLQSRHRDVHGHVDRPMPTLQYARRAARPGFLAQ